MIIHDGTIPNVGPFDSDSDIWYGFRIRNLQEGELLTSYAFLINGQPVNTAGQVVDGVEYKGKAQVDDQQVAVNLAPTADHVGSCRVTLRYSTTNIPSDDKSFDLVIAEQ